MSWFSEAVKRNTPKKNPINHVLQQATGGTSHFTNILLSGLGTGEAGFLGSGGIGGILNAGVAGINPLLSKGLNTLLDANEEGSLMGRVQGFGSNMFGTVRENPISTMLSKGWATQSDRLIPDKYQDVFKGVPQMGIPNIPTPGHGAFKYLNERTKQLRFVENKLYGLRDYAGDLGDKTMQLFGQGKDDGGGGGTGGSTKPSAQRVKGPGTLKGKAARFVMNKSNKNVGRSSLKISRGGRGSSSSTSTYKWKTNM